jgi:hypothetical protein
MVPFAAGRPLRFLEPEEAARRGVIVLGSLHSRP